MPRVECKIDWIFFFCEVSLPRTDITCSLRGAECKDFVFSFYSFPFLLLYFFIAVAFFIWMNCNIFILMLSSRVFFFISLFIKMSEAVYVLLQDCNNASLRNYYHPCHRWGECRECAKYLHFTPLKIKQK